MLPESSDQGADGFAGTQVMEQFELVENAHRTARHVDFLEGNVFGLSALGAVAALQRRGNPRPWTRRL